MFGRNRKRRVLMLTSIAGRDFDVAAGDYWETDEKTAQRLIDTKQAEAADPEEPPKQRKQTKNKRDKRD